MIWHQPGSRACATRGRPGASTSSPTSLPLHAGLHLGSYKVQHPIISKHMQSSGCEKAEGSEECEKDINFYLNSPEILITWQIMHCLFSNSISRCISLWPAAMILLILFDNMWCIFQLPVKRISWCCNKISLPSTETTHHSLSKPPVTLPQLSRCT